MKLIISSVSGEPIYEQIKNQIRSAVMSGELEAGETLPSLRKLAKELRVSVLTVTRRTTNWPMRRGAEPPGQRHLRDGQGQRADATSARNPGSRKPGRGDTRAKAADIALSELGRMLEDEYRKQ